MTWGPSAPSWRPCSATAHGERTWRRPAAGRPPGSRGARRPRRRSPSSSASRASFGAVSIVREAARAPLTYAQASAALRYGDRHGLPGTDVARFGRALAWKLLRRGSVRLGGELA